jgi:hypothetical protein
MISLAALKEKTRTASLASSKPTDDEAVRIRNHKKNLRFVQTEPGTQYSSLPFYFVSQLAKIKRGLMRNNTTISFGPSQCFIREILFWFFILTFFRFSWIFIHNPNNIKGNRMSVCVYVSILVVRGKLLNYN